MPGREETEQLTPAELRGSYLVEGLFEPGELRLAISDLDRLVIGGAMPTPSLRLPSLKELGGGPFLARRELGVINVGGPAVVRVDGHEYELGPMDALYAGAGTKDVEFLESRDGGEAALYLVSAPAHKSYPPALVSRAAMQASPLGDTQHASRRCIYKAIHPAGIPSCQLVMGFTELEEGSVWNTMPPHTHSRRTEIYLYLGLEDQMVVHLMGEPERTKSLIVRDREAVLSPSWSIHAGAGTSNYRFVWAMAGENQDFDDMDKVALEELE
ncbi:5-dehydro-4-deoxy-D-glucuronate isomerase [Paludibaculum fermentans]|uniref:5-dehydro-4-deoxy-D-glucuronate isomerase n=2 Tax=Paludibaculum fermentans TaxID=1473598 RepID=A0A7S7NZR7_PALFE|nr:5-dehydro-4-deoxy-D-glucuronate isomerase [Paludibaculum fermentans]